MSFNPNIPVENTEIDAAELRNQFNALKEMFDQQSERMDDLQGQVSSLQGQLSSVSSTVNSQQSQIIGMQSTLDTRVGFDDLQPNTSANCDGVSSLNLTVSNPPSQGQVQDIANRVDELMATLQRRI